MSTIKVTTLQDTAAGNSSTTEEIFNGRAKAWVNFNGAGTVAIRADFNVNSITDRTTGKYQINMSNSLTDANYCVVNMVAPATNNDPNSACLHKYSGGGLGTGVTPTASLFAVATCRDQDGAAQDAQDVMLAVFR